MCRPMLINNATALQKASCVLSKVATSSSIHVRVRVRVRVSSGRLLLPVKGRVFWRLHLPPGEGFLIGLYGRSNHMTQGVHWIDEIS